MNKKTLGAAGLATAALTLLALAAPTAAFADSSVPPAVGSGATQTDQALYVLDPEEGFPLTQGSSIAWGLQVLGGPSPTDPLAEFSAPAGAQQWYTFISPRGSERNYNAWNGYPYQGASGVVSLAAISPANLATTGTGSPAGAAAVAAQGGDWSLGVAWTNGSNVLKVAYTYITITAGTPSTATYTFAQPAAAATAPAITTQPANASAAAGATATFTAAASGSPAPTVQWQSSSDGTTWTDVNGATSATLTVAGATVAQSGTKYHAVFTNSAGSATTDAATLTVNALFPTQPTGSDAHKVTIAAPVAGDATITVPAGVANAHKTLQVWAWSDPTNLGQQVADADGDVVVDITSLPAGEHTVAFTEPGDATLTVVAWGTFEKLSASGDPLTDDVDLKATVTASDLWSLNAEETQVDFGNVTRGATKTASLGKVTVVDDRNVLKGWDLGVGWTKFTKGADEIPASALTVAGKLYTGYTPVAGIEVGTGTNLAKSTAVSTSPAGALFDADLAFTAPVTAQAGEYHSTLTLTLTSR